MIYNKKKYHKEDVRPMNYYIERLYELLGYFRKLESEGKNVTEEIAALQLCLKRLQKEEADIIRAHTETKLKELEPALAILDEVKTMLQKYS